MIGGGRGGQLLLQEWRDDGQGDELAVGVVKGRAGGGTLVFKDHGTSQALITFEVVDALLPGLKDKRQMVRGQIEPGSAMFGAFDKNLMGTDTGQGLIWRGRVRGGALLDAKGGVFIWQCAHSPGSLGEGR